MSEWTGIVSKANKRDWGSKTIYSWQLAGSNIWLRSEENFNVEEAQALRCTGDTANKITAVESIDASEAKSEAAKPIQDAPPTSSPDYWRWKQAHDLDREDYFQWKDARADATRIVCAALDNDVLALGQAKGKKLDVLIGQIKETTRQLLEQD